MKVGALPLPSLGKRHWHRLCNVALPLDRSLSARRIVRVHWRKELVGGVSQRGRRLSAQDSRRQPLLVTM